MQSLKDEWPSVIGWALYALVSGVFLLYCIGSLVVLAVGHSIPQ